MHQEVVNTISPRMLLRAAKTAAYFEISESTLWHWVRVRHGFPKPIKISQRITLFDVGAIQIFFEKNQLARF
jgi:predicted DNA-binding transcriptional regulator AlpA